MITHDAVWEALSGVLDPELDRPITSLGFVASIDLTPAPRVSLRLPTYFCAPNFAWLMVADARDALAALPTTAPATVILLDHFAADEINAAAAFDAAFPGSGDLSALRLTFDRKAHVAAQERLARALFSPPAGEDLSGLAAMSLSEAARLAPLPAAAVARRRERLGIRSSFALCDDAGTPLAPGDLPQWLRRARTVRVSIDGNAGFCRALLETRYGRSHAGDRSDSSMHDQRPSHPDHI